MSDEAEVSFVPMAAVEEESGRLDASQTRPIGSVRKGYTPFSENDVIFAKITPCMENGKIALATGLKNGRAYGSTEFIVFRPHSGLLPRFVLHFLLQPSVRESAEHQMAGASGQKRVPTRFLSALEFLLPPTREQERILAKLDAALSKLERAETAAHRAKEKLRRYRTAVLDAAFSGELTRDWRDDRRTDRQKIETGEDLLHRLLDARRVRWEQTYRERLHANGKAPKDDKWKSGYPEPERPNTTGLAKLPNGWAWGSLDQCFQVERGRFSIRPRNDPAYYNGKYPFIQIGDLPPDGGLIREYSQTLNDKGLEVSKQFSRGTILIAIVGATIANSGILGFDACCPDSLVAVQSSDTALLGFADLWIRANKLKLRGAAVASGGQPNINLQVLRPFATPLPPVIEQIELVQRVEKRFTAAARLELTLKRQTARGREVRQSLVHEAFTGRLIPQDEMDESAAVLLERIRKEATELRRSPKGRSERVQPAAQKGSDSMQDQQPPSLEFLHAAWERIGRKPDAHRLFDEAGFGPDQVVQFYESLRADPELRAAFQRAASRTKPQESHSSKRTQEQSEQPGGRFRLVRLWLQDFKNLKNYNVQFDPTQGLDVVLGWNGTGKSNLFEALVIIFRDLHDWWDKNRWPDKPMNGFILGYEMDEHSVEVVWRPGEMKRPELKRGPIVRGTETPLTLEPIRREHLPLPRFVFGYYSGPTNRLAEHFLPMKQAHYIRLREAKSDDPRTLAKLLEQRRFFCAETHHAKYVLLAFSYREDQKIKDFLENRLRIVGFESALFIIRKPRWARPGSDETDFWGAKGIMRRVMERLRRYAIAPMVLKQNVSDGYRSGTEDHYYFFLPDIESLQAFAAEYRDARTFFLALESTDFSELIHDVKIQVRVKSTITDQVSITFHQLSEGEQQLLMVLGLLRFTKARQSLVLLDEPDTHLNPHWSVDYLKDLAQVMRDNIQESSEQQTSQILMATHDPLVIASLVKEQIHLLKRDWETGACKWVPATVNPRGLGFTGILTSEMFGFRSDLDEETLADLDNRVRLVAKEGELTGPEKQELETIDKRLADAGFSKAFSDPYYAAFVRAWGRRHSELMAGQPVLSQEQLQEVDRIAGEVLKEAVAEVEKEVAP